MVALAKKSIVYERDNLEESIYKTLLDFEENAGVRISHLWLENWSISYDRFACDSRGELTMGIKFDETREKSNGN